MLADKTITYFICLWLRLNKQFQALCKALLCIAAHTSNTQAFTAESLPSPLYKGGLTDLAQERKKDRRKETGKTVFPLKDSEGCLILEERRMQPDPRLESAIEVKWEPQDQE